MSIKDFPQMVFKSKEDYETVNSIEEMEKLAKDGYGPYDVVVLGRKPVKVVDPEEVVKAAKEKIEKELTEKITAELDDKAKVALSDNKRLVAELNELAVNHEKIISESQKKDETIAALEKLISELEVKLAEKKPAKEKTKTAA